MHITRMRASLRLCVTGHYDQGTAAARPARHPARTVDQMRPSPCVQSAWTALILTLAAVVGDRPPYEEVWSAGIRRGALRVSLGPAARMSRRSAQPPRRRPTESPDRSGHRHQLSAAPGRRAAGLPQRRPQRAGHRVANHRAILAQPPAAHPRPATDPRRTPGRPAGHGIRRRRFGLRPRLGVNRRLRRRSPRLAPRWSDDRTGLALALGIRVQRLPRPDPDHRPTRR